MAHNLFEMVRSVISPGLISSISSILGENEHAVTKAIDAAIPTVLTTISDRYSFDRDDVQMLVSQALASGMASNISGLFEGNSGMLGKGANMVTSLLGNKAGVVSSIISSYAGVKPSSVSTILSCITPIVLEMVGHHTKDMDAGEARAWLASQEASLGGLIPPELNIKSLFSARPEQSVGMAIENKKEERFPVWALLLLMLITSALLIWYFLGKVRTEEIIPKVLSATQAIQEAPVAKQILKLELPNGVVIDAYPGGIEDQLVRFLKDSTTVAGKDTWFDFDNLNFAVGTADISPESQVQINNIMAILKAFPKAKIKIGGYTDKTGDESANLTLSEKRAEAVKEALVAGGVGEQVTGAEGYGSQFAKIPAEAPESARLADRRVSVSVREK